MFVRNRLIKAKRYTTIINSNTSDTLQFTDLPGETFYLQASKEYLYDVHDQLIGTREYNETDSPRRLTEARKYLHERGHCVVGTNKGVRQTKDKQRCQEPLFVRMVRRLGLEGTLRPRGRPKKQNKGS